MLQTIMDFEQIRETLKKQAESKQSEITQESWKRQEKKEYKNKSNNLNEGQKREKDNLLAKHTRLQIIF